MPLAFEIASGLSKISQIVGGTNEENYRKIKYDVYAFLMSSPEENFEELYVILHTLKLTDPSYDLVNQLIYNGSNFRIAVVLNVEKKFGAGLVKGTNYPLCEAVLRNDVETMELLMNWKWDFGNTSSTGIDAFAYAAMGGKVEMMEILFENGADPNTKGSDGFTPMTRNSEIGTINVTNVRNALCRMDVE